MHQWSHEGGDSCRPAPPPTRCSASPSTTENTDNPSTSDRCSGSSSNSHSESRPRRRHATAWPYDAYISGMVCLLLCILPLSTADVGAAQTASAVVSKELLPIRPGTRSSLPQSFFEPPLLHVYRSRLVTSFGGKNSSGCHCHEAS